MQQEMQLESQDSIGGLNQISIVYCQIELNFAYEALIGALL